MTGLIVIAVKEDVSPREVDQAVELATDRVAEVQETFASELDEGSVREDLATTVKRRAEDLDVLADEAYKRTADERPSARTSGSSEPRQ